MNQKTHLTISSKVDDLKYSISQIETHIFYLFGKELKKSPNDKDKINDWLKKNKNAIESKLLRYINIQRSILSKEVYRLLKNISIISTEEANSYLDKKDKKPNYSEQKLSNFIEKKDIDKVNKQLMKLIKRLKFSIQQLLNNKNISSIISNVKKGMDVEKAIDKVTKEEVDNFGKYTDRNKIKRTSLNIFGESLRGASLDIFVASYTKRMQASGKGLIIISQHNDASPICSPLQGKIYALDEISLKNGIDKGLIPKEYNIKLPKEFKKSKDDFKTKIRPLFKEARNWITTRNNKQIGLMNFKYCRHTFTPYFEGITDKYEEIDEKEVEKNRNLRKEAINIEKQIIRWRKLYQVAISNSNKAFNYSKWKEWIAKGKQFEKTNGFNIRGLQQKKYSSPSKNVLEKLI